jgi:hypothetical protein
MFREIPCFVDRRVGDNTFAQRFRLPSFPGKPQSKESQVVLQFINRCKTDFPQQKLFKSPVALNSSMPLLMVVSPV